MATNQIIKPITQNLSPIIVILGSTAVGKSKLGIELAKKFNGEIISADSMQVYKGLDIITNKVTSDEQVEVKHHLINIVKPPAEFTVTEFQKLTLDIIGDLHKQNKVPIIVGGTNYYIESILWNFLIEEKKKVKLIDDKEERSLLKRKLIATKQDESKDSKQSLYEQLMSVDPERANQLHPNDTRKISRSLQIYAASGSKHSELIDTQKQLPGSSHLGGPLRFSKALVFWLTCEQEELDSRITKRIDEMFTRGLLKEVADFYEQYKNEKFSKHEVENSSVVEKEISEHNIKFTSLDNTILGKDDKLSTEKIEILEKLSTGCGTVDTNNASKHLLYQEGLFQAIGFKEFHPYFTSNENNSPGEKEKLLQECKENFKRVTIRYSKKQKTWVKHRFISRQNSPDVYHLDATYLLNWGKNVFETALQISQQFLQNEAITTKPMNKETDQKQGDKHKKHICELCENKVLLGDNIWEIHLKSRMHRRRLQKDKKYKEKNS